MTNTKHDALKAHAGMIFWAVIVGLSFPAVGLLREGLPPLLLTAMRFAIAALVLLPLVRRVPGLLPSREGWLLYAVMGLSLAGFFGAMFWAAHRASALSMAALYISVPLIAFLLGRIMAVEGRSPQLLLILMLGATGALGLVWAEAGSWQQFQFGKGEIVYLMGCAVSALYPVLSKWGLQRRWLSPRAEIRTFWSLVLGSLLIAALGLAIEPAADLLHMGLRDVLVVVYLAVFSSGLTFWLMQRATAVMTPGAVTAYSYLTPFVSMVLLFVQQPQVMGPHWLPGSTLVVAATAWLLYRDLRTPRLPNPSTPISRQPGNA